ncbi:hybrid sensor histidine kinase/response regulator transcription factor [Flavilitoribacter nigricans]|uniref:histidine kinase n=1 Tax=Flavilitoribacter nigricans (strain ATCC 23147 / DSM 23189 / NBRC 102662 / NCIMB 1420 / SS-2) TaxID=1122177 RepID=A0A2D0N9L7_FLAN2|nr:two-component regulator propeller domain-containing protein [Flavilitoribacter nigricans]PHN05167.1 hypothetical protein CRP01_16740 [Flavilitoribacter nigricans DSM 23189 = NBRC 102662]
MNRNYFFASDLKILNSILLLLLMQGLSGLYAQQLPPQERFRHLTIDDGLSQNAVQAILQDHLGFIWFGTKDGLNRYDGYEFSVFQHLPGDETSLSNNFVLDLFEDRDQNLWVGTRNGLNRYNEEKGIFEIYDFAEFATDLNPNVAVSDIVQDKNGALWMSVSRKYLVKIPLENTADTIQHPVVISDTFEDISHIHYDGQHLWIGSSKRLYRFDDSGNEISRHVIKVGQGDPSLSTKDEAVNYIVDTQHPGFLWLGKSSGLCYFEKKTGKFQFFPNHYLNERPGWGRMNFILPDPGSGKLWIGTYHELMRFDPSTGRYEYFNPRFEDLTGFHGAGILAGIADHSGQLWFGTNGYGINITDSRNTGIKMLKYELPEWTRLKSFSIRSIFKDRDNNVWVGAQALHRWNRKKGEIISYESRVAPSENIGSGLVYSIIEDEEGWLWLASTLGLSRYHVSDSTVVEFRHRPDDPTSLPERSTFCVYQDRSGDIWTVTRNFFSKLNRETGTFTSLRYRNNLNKDPVFVRIIEDQYGKFWMNSEIGLIHFDPKTWAMRTYQHDPKDEQSISTNVLRHLCPDPREPDRYLWLATAGGGVDKFDMVDKTCDHITTDDGLPDNVVYSILPDEAGNLWMSTNKGLSCFDPVNFTFKNYDARDGLQSNEFNSGAYFRAPDGEMFFGGIKGLNYFYPRQLADNSFIPPVHITGLGVGSRRVYPGDSTGILQQQVMFQDQITLNYKDDVVTFYFAAMDFVAPEKNRFRYKLSGWDNQWIEAGTRSSATYTNLPHGAYTFSVQGTNSDGVWSETGASIRLLITPPFWLTWWAKTIYSIILLAMVYALLSYQRKRSQLKHQLAIEKVEKRKLQELDQLKSKFFTDIAHEFRTPLTLILGPIEQLKGKMAPGPDTRNLSLMEQNADQLLAMINQIMDLSKLETGKERLHPRTGELIQLLRGVTESYRTMAETRRISLGLTSALTSAHGEFDHQKIEQILSNLLSNAIKYSRAGDAVTVAIADIDDPAADPESPVSVHFSVTDTGPGIAEPYLDHIFQRFYRVEGAGEESRNGSGIGLALVKELADLHGGRVSVESQPGKGTCFRVSLPLQLSHWEREKIAINFQNGVPAAKPADPPELAPCVKNENKHVVLIIEDNTDVRSFISHVLEPDFTTVAVSNGADGIARAQELMPDLIITDVMMPGMNGYEVCHELTQHALTSHIPVIMLTAKTSREDQYAGYTAGADAYLTKPFKSEELQLRTRMLIEKRQALQEKFSALAPGFEKAVYRNETENQFLQTILDLLHTEVSNPDLDISQLARAVHMSERQLRRKFKAVIGQSPNQFIRLYRLRRAHELLRAGTGNVSEICFEVGFNNVSYFSKCFREEYGLSPSEVC